MLEDLLSGVYLALDFEFLAPNLLKSTQYKKLVPNTMRFTHQNLKSCKSKNEARNLKHLLLSFSPID